MGALFMNRIPSIWAIVVIQRLTSQFDVLDSKLTNRFTTYILWLYECRVRVTPEIIFLEIRLLRLFHLCAQTYLGHLLTVLVPLPCRLDEAPCPCPPLVWVDLECALQVLPMHHSECHGHKLQVISFAGECLQFSYCFSSSCWCWTADPRAGK
jgi:hypothetical protein